MVEILERLKGVWWLVESEKQRRKSRGGWLQLCDLGRWLDSVVVHRDRARVRSATGRWQLWLWTHWVEADSKVMIILFCLPHLFLWAPTKVIGENRKHIVELHTKVLFKVISFSRSSGSSSQFPGKPEETSCHILPFKILMRVDSLPLGKMHIYLGCLKIKFIAIELPFIWPQSTLTFFELHC